MITLQLIKDYTKYLNLTCDDEACQDILDFGNAIGATDYKDAVWEFLDEFEGIAHSADPEYWGPDHDEY